MRELIRRIGEIVTIMVQFWIASECKQRKNDDRQGLAKTPYIVLCIEEKQTWTRIVQSENGHNYKI
jgi:hypothetical protein